MTNSVPVTIDPKLDLVLERIVDVPPELVWKAWTEPEHLMKWFAPRPWSVSECQIDLRPGGLFRTVMRSPEGDPFPNVGCYLEVIPNRRLVWTDALLEGFRPSPAPNTSCFIGGFFTGIITMEPHGAGTKYVAIAVHGVEDSKKKHEEMGFHEGWGVALDQLVEVAKTLRG